MALVTKKSVNDGLSKFIDYFHNNNGFEEIRDTLISETTEFIKERANRNKIYESLCIEKSDGRDFNLTFNDSKLSPVKDIDKRSIRLKFNSDIYYENFINERAYMPEDLYKMMDTLLLKLFIRKIKKFCHLSKENISLFEIYQFKNYETGGFPVISSSSYSPSDSEKEPIRNNLLKYMRYAFSSNEDISFRNNNKLETWKFNECLITSYGWQGYSKDRHFMSYIPNSSNMIEGYLQQLIPNLDYIDPDKNNSNDFDGIELVIGLPSNYYFTIVSVDNKKYTFKINLDWGVFKMLDSLSNDNLILKFFKYGRYSSTNKMIKAANILKKIENSEWTEKFNYLLNNKLLKSLIKEDQIALYKTVVEKRIQGMYGAPEITIDIYKGNNIKGRLNIKLSTTDTADLSVRFQYNTTKNRFYKKFSSSVFYKEGTNPHINMLCKLVTRISKYKNMILELFSTYYIPLINNIKREEKEETDKDFKQFFLDENYSIKDLFNTISFLDQDICSNDKWSLDKVYDILLENVKIKDVKNLDFKMKLVEGGCLISENNSN